jgi:hypothetical protein
MASHLAARSHKQQQFGLKIHTFVLVWVKQLSNPSKDLYHWVDLNYLPLRLRPGAVFAFGQQIHLR